MKTAIIYFSLTGFTKSIAETMAKVLDADLIPLLTEDAQSKDSKFISILKGGSQVMGKKKPKLIEYNFNPADYDLVIIGTPVWAWSFVPALRTFFGEHDLAGKKVAVYATHQGGPGKTLKNMIAEMPEASIVGERDFLNEKGKESRSLSNARLWAAELIKKTNLPI
ncbi:MAG: flavodoxin [Candidatus Stygibacter australis]|nr:flavodoxin [Candidatus Stygibacter australis]MDP8321044.1 flavodoxin [Candidatus Stygibacter australis]